MKNLNGDGEEIKMNGQNEAIGKIQFGKVAVHDQNDTRNYSLYVGLERES